MAWRDAARHANDAREDTGGAGALDAAEQILARRRLRHRVPLGEQSFERLGVEARRERERHAAPLAARRGAPLGDEQAWMKMAPFFTGCPLCAHDINH